MSRVYDVTLRAVDGPDHGTTATIEGYGNTRKTAERSAAAKFMRRVRCEGYVVRHIAPRRKT